jgi:hypothetical protein
VWRYSVCATTAGIPIVTIGRAANLAVITVNLDWYTRGLFTGVNAGSYVD